MTAFEATFEAEEPQFHKYPEQKLKCQIKIIIIYNKLFNHQNDYINLKPFAKFNDFFSSSEITAASVYIDVVIDWGGTELSSVATFGGWLLSVLVVAKLLVDVDLRFSLVEEESLLEFGEEAELAKNPLKDLNISRKVKLTINQIN